MILSERLEQAHKLMAKTAGKLSMSIEKRKITKSDIEQIKLVLKQVEELLTFDN